MIRVAASDGDLATIIELRERIDPLTATTVEDQRVFAAQADGVLQLLAGDVGFATAARFPDEVPVANLGVVPEHRRRGLGGELFARVSRHAREQGWTELQLTASDPDGIAWLGRRGFREVDRQPRVVLELDAAAAVPPARALTDYAERPDLAPALHALLVDALADVPGALAEDVPTLETWLDWQRAPSRRPEFLVIALGHDGDPVGYAQLHVYPRVGYHGFTAVARSHRRAGVARALKLELIRRARERGLERLITQSNERNVAMRTLNEQLGYRPAPPLVVFRGPPL